MSPWLWAGLLPVMHGKGSVGRLLKRKGKDSPSEFNSPDVGCVLFFFRRGARIKSEV